MKITYDPLAKAVYIRLRKGEYEGTVEVADDIHVDYTVDDAVLGIEILNISENIEFVTLNYELD